VARRGRARGIQMSGRIRIASVGLVAMTVVGAMSSTAGAQTPNQWSVQANGGFVSLSLLNTLAFSGGGSEADASSAPLAEASGTGACLSTAATSNPCPTSATSSLSGDALDSTQDAVAKGSGTTATPTGASNCPLPINTGLLDVDVLCGSAAASEDANGNPTATGTGSIVNASLNLSLTAVLQSILGGSLPAASSLCGNVPAATTAPGTNGATLPGPEQSLLGTVNGILPANLALNPTSVAGGSDLTGECSIVSGLLTQLDAAGSSSPVTSALTGILNQVLGLTGAHASAVQPLVVTLGGSTSSVSTSGNVVTDAVTQRALEVNLFGLADLQVAPTTASVALDRSTGTVTPSCSAGVVSYATNGSLPTFVNITQIDALVNQILQTLGSTGSALSGALQTLLGDLITYDPTGNLLTCDTTAPGTTASAKVGVLNLGLLSGLMGGLGLEAGDVSVTGSATVASPAVATAPATTIAPPVATPAAVPNVTSVHTGEYWAGTLPIVVMAGMGLTGLVLIGRRRIAALARHVNPHTRRRGGP
jgi:hypothetical protein